MATIKEIKDQERDVMRSYNRPPYRSQNYEVRRSESAAARPNNPYQLFHNDHLLFIYKMIQDQWYWYGVHFTDPYYSAFVDNYNIIQSELKLRGLL